MTDVWEGPEYSYCQISTIKNKAKNDDNNNNNNNNNNNDEVYTNKRMKSLVISKNKNC